RQCFTKSFRKCAKYRPVLARIARREYGAPAKLDAAFRVDPDRILFRIGGGGKNNIRRARPDIAVAALIDYEGVLEPARVDLIGPQQEENVERSIQHLKGGFAPLTRQQAEIETGNARRGRMQDVEAVPSVADKAEAVGDLLCEGQHRRPVRPGERTLPDDEHRPLGIFQNIGERMLAL